MIRARAALPLGLLLVAAGCRSPVEPPDLDPADAPARRAIYQEIASALPRATFGWGTPPGVIHMTPSAKAEGPPPELPPLRANEEGFLLHYEVYRPASIWVPYEAIEGAYWSWRAIPNAFFVPLVVLPLQVVRATVVFDADRLGSSLLGRLRSDIGRLEAASREVGLGGPWSFAQDVKAKLADDAADHGEGRLSVHFDYVVPIPAWLPVGGPAQTTAEAFAWAAAHPEAEALQARPEEGAPAPR